MSKKYIVIIIIVIALAGAVVGGNYWYNSEYENTDARDLPVIPINVANQHVIPISGEFTMPLFGNAQVRYPMIMGALRSILGDDRLEKQLECVPDDGLWLTAPEGGEPGDGAELGLLGEIPYVFEFDLPDTMYWSAKLVYIDDTGAEALIYVGGGAKQDEPHGYVDSVALLKSGEYYFTAEGTLHKSGPDTPSGIVIYEAGFSLKNPDPVFTIGRTELAQGDILSLKLENIPEGIVPELESELGPAIFTQGVPYEETTNLYPQGFTNWYAMIPVSNSRKVGEYPVAVNAGELYFETTVTVEEYEFDFQNMIIDMSVPSVASSVTGDAIAEFREKVIPLFSVFTEERYWSGVFIIPVEMGPEDFISTEFGEIRITNGNQSTRRSHLGMDIAASTGTPVLASGTGMVLLAEFLMNTGYTVVIDHGGGLISIYYHMVGVDTTAGSLVERGELIGRVGSTGYSTGPHLHFEMRIGEQPISPSMLFDPKAGLYSAK